MTDVSLVAKSGQACLDSSNISEFSVEYNKLLKVPHVKKVSPTGYFDLKFDERRIIEADGRCL